MGYSLQGNRKTLEGKQHPDRNAQFEYINTHVTHEMRAAQPVISVDTKVTISQTLLFLERIPTAFMN